MDVNLTTIFLLSFSAGIVHALDADHVMAVTGIASKKYELKEIVRICIRWSLGHGMTLLALGTVFYGFGVVLPEALSEYAEKLIALLLIFIGLWIFYDLKKSGAHLHFHDHDGMQKHAHWHTHEHQHSATDVDNEIRHKAHSHSNHSHSHGAVLIGIVHGLAGLAPLLAVIPLANQPAWIAIFYLLLFCIGVLLAMIIFGGVLGKSINLIQRYGTVSINTVRGLVGFSSIALGITWL